MRKNSNVLRLSKGDQGRKQSRRTSTILKPFTRITLENVGTAKEEEKRYEYDNFQTTGDFDSDFLFLCHLVDVPVTVSRRKKSLPSSQESRAGSGRKLRPNSRGYKDERRVSEGNILKDKVLDYYETTILTNTEEKFSEHSINTIVANTQSTPSSNQFFKNSLKRRVETSIDFDDSKSKGDPYVKEIYLRGWKVDLPVINVLFKTLPDLYGLTYLNMGNAGLVNDSLYCLAQCLALIPSLQTLCLDGNNFVTSQRFDMFLQNSNSAASPGQQALKHLSLKNCNVDEEGASYLAEALARNKHLLTLNLCFNKLGNEGARHMAHSLRMNRTLLSINMGRNRIGDEGVKYIADAMTTFPLTHEEIVARRVKQSIAKEGLLKVASLEKPGIIVTRRSAKKDLSKTTNKKEIKPKRKKATTGNVELVKRVSFEMPREKEFNDPLLEEAIVIDGELWIPGNRSLVNLNLSSNMITKIGLALLYAAIKYQDNASLQTDGSSGTGLVRLSLQKNVFSEDDSAFVALLDLIKTRDPFSEPDVLLRPDSSRLRRTNSIY